MAGTPEALEKTLALWKPNTETWERLGDSLFTTAVKCDLAGQLMVRTDSKPVVKLAASVDEPFLNLPWVEAIAEYKARGIMNERELSTLLKDYAQRSDAARRLMVAQIQEFVRSQVVVALEKGSTFKQFGEAIRNGDASLGITADDPAYLNMVFRTNVQSAYGAGRYRAMTDPDVMNERPYAEFRTVGDARVREEHAVLNGTITRIGTPAHRKCACPLGFACRCAQVAITEAERAGREVIDDVPPGFKATPGFDGPPVAKIHAIPGDPAKAKLIPKAAPLPAAGVEAKTVKADPTKAPPPLEKPKAVDDTAARRRRIEAEIVSAMAEADAYESEISRRHDLTFGGVNAVLLAETSAAAARDKIAAERATLKAALKALRKGLKTQVDALKTSADEAAIGTIKSLKAKFKADATAAEQEFVRAIEHVQVDPKMLESAKKQADEEREYYESPAYRKELEPGLREDAAKLGYTTKAEVDNYVDVIHKSEVIARRDELAERKQVAEQRFGSRAGYEAELKADHAAKVRRINTETAEDLREDAVKNGAENEREVDEYVAKAVKHQIQEVDDELEGALEVIDKDGHWSDSWDDDDEDD